MSGLEVLGVLLGLYPLVVHLAKGYKLMKGGGGDSELHRNLIVAYTRFENTVKGLLESCSIPYRELQQLSSRQADQELWKDPILQQKLRNRIGEEKLDVALDHLLQIRTLLEQVKEELEGLSPRGDGDSLHRSSVRTLIKLTLANMPQSRIQGNVKRVRLLNDDLRALLDDRPIMRSYQLAPESGTTAAISDITQTGVPRASEFFETVKKLYTCRCIQPHAIGFGCSCITCAQPFSEKLDLHSADEWEFCLAFNTPEVENPAPDTAILLQSVRDADVEDARPTTAQDMCSLVANIAGPEASVTEVLLDTAEAEDSKPHRMKVCKIGGNSEEKRLPSIKSFEELRCDATLSTKYKLELAIRLSLAILQLSNTPWVSESWTWNDVCVTKMEVSSPSSNSKASKIDAQDTALETAESSVLFILHKRIYSATRNSERVSLAPTIVAVPRAVSIIDEEPAMTKLGLALIELALGKSIQEMKEEYGLHEIPENEIGNICTATKLLEDKKIRAMVGGDYERVVDVCLKRRVVDSRGVPMNIWSKHESFLSMFRDNIVRPLYLMWRNY